MREDNNMIRVGMIGFGFMGKMHLENYMRLESEGYPVRVTAICDVDQENSQARPLEEY